METMPVEGADGVTRQVKSPAAEAGLRAGDRILTIDGDGIENWDDVREAIITGSQRSADGRRQSDFLIERDGEVRQIIVHPRLAGDESIRQAGIAPAYDVIVERVLADSPADRIGLQSGDVFVSIDGVPIRNEVTYFDVLTAESAAPRALVVRRNGQEITLALPSERGPIVVNVVPESPAAAIGLQAGDRILSVNGRNLIDSRSLVDELDRLRDQDLNLVVRRGAQTLTVTAPARPGGDGKLGVEVTSLLGEELTIPASIAYINPVRQFEKHIRSTFRVLGSLLHPQSDIGLSKMSGPVGIMRVYYHAVRAEFRFVLWLTILVNINLAIFNLLPIPVLDGGHMLFATITKLRGRAIPPQLLVTVQSTFMALLLLMVIYVTFFDVRRSIRDISGESPRAAPPPEAPAENPDSSGAPTPEAP
jgi:regulator of sigma E protease